MPTLFSIYNTHTLTRHWFCAEGCAKITDRITHQHIRRTHDYNTTSPTPSHKHTHTHTRSLGHAGPLLATLHSTTLRPLRTTFLASPPTSTHTRFCTNESRLGSSSSTWVAAPRARNTRTISRPTAVRIPTPFQHTRAHTHTQRMCVCVRGNMEQALREVPGGWTHDERTNERTHGRTGAHWTGAHTHTRTHNGGGEVGKTACFAIFLTTIVLGCTPYFAPSAPAQQ